MGEIPETVMDRLGEIGRKGAERLAAENAQLREALTEAREIILALRLHGGKLSNCCFNSAQAGGFAEVSATGPGADESRKRVVRVLRESVKTWDEVDAMAGDATKRFGAALAATPGEAQDVRREEQVAPEEVVRDPDAFWVAELTHSGTGHVMGFYWNGQTRFPLEPVTTQDIYEALKFRDAASCQEWIDRIGYCKAGILTPVEHVWLRALPTETTPEGGE